MNDSISDQFNRIGYVHFEQVIPLADMQTVRDIGLAMKSEILDGNLLEKPKDFGAPVYSRSIDMSSKLNDKLTGLCASPWLIKIAKTILNKESIYLFNDQIVIKMPMEDFLFPAHADNWFGPDPQAAETGKFRTITCCWVLDDMTEFNGPISIIDSETNEWVTPMAKAGDLLIWDGNTMHKSNINTSENPRCVWLQIFATHDISHMRNVNDRPYVAPVDFTRFHSVKI